MEQFFRKLLDILAKIFSGLDEKSNPPPVHFRNERVLETARKELGVKEIKGGRNKRIEEYHAYASIKNNEYLKQEIPWCASFVAFCLEKSGMGSTNNRTAKSYLKWGVSTKSDAWPGDIVVFDRGGWKGHVGFFLKESGGYVWVLGGNQSDAVTVARYGKSNMMDIRRSSLHRKLTEVEEDRLIDFAEGIIKQAKVHVGGSQS